MSNLVNMADEQQTSSEILTDAVMQQHFDKFDYDVVVFCEQRGIEDINIGGVLFRIFQKIGELESTIGNLKQSVLEVDKTLSEEFKENDSWKHLIRTLSD